MGSTNAFAEYEKTNLKFIVSPYLLKPSPNEMTIMFESICAFPRLYYKEKGQKTFMQTTPHRVLGLPSLKKVLLQNLKSNTEYEYKIETPLRKSKTYTFKTWPDLSDHINIVKIAAISDTQGDHPKRLNDIIQNGIANEENISALLISGDIVTNGTNKKQWVNDFFKNMEPLISKIPILPALGNHDMIPFLYACYFDLMPDKNEHTSPSKLYSRANLLNTAILTLNTNNLIELENVGDYEDICQRIWLDTQLTDIASDPNINFLIAQFHHPCKSELWTAGNCTRSCDYVKKFEEFTQDSNKPSLHLFGHTHAYSRGQSKNAKHLWINVATSAGDIDYWGEYNMQDYDEFQKSYDEYGYSIITITRGTSPSIQVLRKSGGDDNVYNSYKVINDDITIRYNNDKPQTPEINVTVSDKICLSGSPFQDLDDDTHLESNWQISKTTGFENIEQDIWGNKTRSENIWYDINTQENVDITKYNILSMPAKGDYYARVRYRDSGLEWSEWSDPEKFTIK